MKQTEIIELIGLKSTEPKLIAFFEKYGLKAPKTVNANSSGKAIRHKEYNIDFDFHYDIVNDAFYPPVSPKKTIMTLLLIYGISTYTHQKKISDPVNFGTLHQVQMPLMKNLKIILAK